MKQLPLLSLQQVNWRYEDGPALALNDINLHLFPGEVVGVVGLSGAGKTTLLLALAGLIPANYAGDFSGQRETGGEIGIVFQDPETQFIGLSVEEEIAFSMENKGYHDADMEQRITEVLQLVGLAGFANRSPFELSGGEKQRVAIASALAVSPQLLILDEPTSELDPRGTKEVFSLLRQLKVEKQMSIVVSSHATEELAQFCDRLLLIADGSIVYDMPTRSFFQHIEELTAHGILVPEMIQLYRWLEQRGVITENNDNIPLDLQEMLLIYNTLQNALGVGR